MGRQTRTLRDGRAHGTSSAYEWMRHRREVKIQETAAVIEEIGPQNFILATDLGKQVTRPRRTASSSS
jgi:hypothetical protein